MASPLHLSPDVLLTEHDRTLVGRGVWETCAGFQPHCQESTGATTTWRLSGLVLTGIRGSRIRVPPGSSLYCCSSHPGQGSTILGSLSPESRAVPSNTVATPHMAMCMHAQLCPTLCDPMDYSSPGFFVLHYLPEFAQIHVQ